MRMIGKKFVAFDSPSAQHTHTQDNIFVEGRFVGGTPITLRLIKRIQ